MGVPMAMGMGRREPLRRTSRPPVGGYMMDPGDIRAHSAPDSVMGYGYTGARGPPRPDPRAMSPHIGRGRSPPAYGRAMDSDPYAFQPGRAPTPGQAQTPLPMPTPQQPQPRRPMRPPGLNEIPMGAYAAGAPPPPAPVRANIEPPTSSRLNRRQSSSKKAGPSGQEWIEGDPFLDACTCTTNCTCRKGQRVLYRSQAQDGDGHKGWGEIRYVLKDDLGKDCGDHSKCHGHTHEDESDGGKKGKKKGKPRKQDSEKDEFHEEMRERMKALQEDLAGMKLKDRSNRPGIPPSSPYGPMPPNGPPPEMMEGMDPRLAAQYGGGPFGTGGPSRPRPPPPGMGGPLGARRDRMPRSGFPDPGMPPGMDLVDEQPCSESGYGLDDMASPMEMGGRLPRQRMGGGRRAMPADLMGAFPPRRPRGRGPRGLPPDMDLGSGGFGRGPAPPPMGRRERRQRNGGGRRRARLDFDEDGMSVGMGMRGGLGGRGGPREDYGDVEDDGDEPWEDLHGTAPYVNQGDGGTNVSAADGGGGGMRRSPPGRGRDGGRLGRHMNRGGHQGRQPHVEDGDEDVDC